MMLFTLIFSLSYL